MDMHTKPSLRLTQGIEFGREGAISFRRWLLRRFWLEREAIRRRRDLERLMTMSPRELNDIGLSRSEVEMAYRQSHLL